MTAAVFAHHSPRDSARVLWTVPSAGVEEIDQATRVAREAWASWRRSTCADRAELLRRLARLISANSHSLAIQIAEEVGKPLTQAAAEVRRSAQIVEDVAGRAADALEIRTAPDAYFRYCPVGVLAVVSPWNNPLAIPVGKLAPAILYGNTVVWKPAIAGIGLAVRLIELLEAAGCPRGCVNMIRGDHRTAQHLVAEAGIDAVTVTGSIEAGHALQELCVRRHIPLQGELGGNNAAIVWHDSDLSGAARQVAEGAFGFAGQRCTANRRVIVSADCFEQFMTQLQSAVADLVWGDPMAPETQVGPLISVQKRDQVAAVVARAIPAAETILVPHSAQASSDGSFRKGSYYPPTIVVCPDPAHEIVQEETFGPVLVVERADDFSRAIALLNGVRQGLVAALFSQSSRLQEWFLQDAQAGILKINRATADADARTPFGGWKASGIGPPEHGSADREFHTRTQAIYH